MHQEFETNLAMSVETVRCGDVLAGHCLRQRQPPSKEVGDGQARRKLEAKPFEL